MYKDIKYFFKKNMPQLRASISLTKKLKNFRLIWSTKNYEYIDFLSSNLLGVYDIKFSKLDDNMLMESTLGVKNYIKLQKEIYKVRGIEKNYNIGSNIIYQTLLYIIYLYATDKKLKKEDVGAGIMEACLIMQYRMFTSLHSHYFSEYTIPEYIASDVYNKLSQKYLIKKLGSWQEVFKYRAQSCIDKKSIIHKKFKEYTTKDSLYALANIQTNIREQIKFIFRILIKVLEENNIHTPEKAFFVGGDDNLEQLRDVDSNIFKTINYIKSIAINTNDFIDRKTMLIVLSLFNGTKFEEFYRILKSMSNPDKVDAKNIEYIVEKIIMISYTYLNKLNLNVNDKKNLTKVITAVKFYWSSSKVKNEDMADIKSKVNELVNIFTARKTKWVITTYTLAYILYVFLRSIKK